MTTAVLPRLTTLVRLAAATPLTPATTRFWFLRHGETDGNRLRIVQGREVPLNDTGRRQARLAAEPLAAEGIERIVASDLERTRETAGIVGAALGVAPDVTEALREKWFGDLVGRSSIDLDWDTTPANGESLPDFVRRTCAGLEAALAGDRRTLVVAHGGTLYVLCAALGIAVQGPLAANATPLRFSHAGGRWQAEALAPAAPDPTLPN